MKGYTNPIRFYVQGPHIDGFTVIDRVQSSMVISSFGDTDIQARRALETVAAALNAATAPLPSMYATDMFKNVHSSLAWRVIEHLSRLVR